MASLSVKELSKNFGKLQALNNLNLEVEDGEFFVVLGPTAAGKTTTLKCLTGLLTPDEGEVHMDDEAVQALSPAERDVALVFQTYALYPRKTVFENMAFPLKARQMSPEDIKTRVTEIAAKLQISPYLDRKPAQLSGGQQQRVALGRAMVRDPRIFFMDEPLTNLDFKLRAEMRAELKRQQQELGKTFFYVTNDQVEAMSMADRIMVLNQGVVQQIDVPETIYDDPANLFVARFVGNPRMNTLDCTIDTTNNTISGEGWRLVLPELVEHFAINSDNKQSYIMGIRAEDIRIHRQAQDTFFAAEIFVTEPLGDKTIVDISLGDVNLKVREEAGFDLAVGSQVWLELDASKIHLFDKTTHKSIRKANS